MEQSAGSCLVCHRLKVQVLLRVFFSLHFFKLLFPFQLIFFFSFVHFSFNPSIVFPFLFFPPSLFFSVLTFLTHSLFFCHFSYSVPLHSSFLFISFLHLQQKFQPVAVTISSHLATLFIILFFLMLSLLFFPHSLFSFFFPSYITFFYSLPFLSSFIVAILLSPSLLLLSLYSFSTLSIKDIGLYYDVTSFTLCIKSLHHFYKLLLVEIFPLHFPK